MSEYPVRIKVTEKVRDELIIGNNADQIGATPGDGYKEALLRSKTHIVINDPAEHESLIDMIEEHEDRARDWGFEGAWFVRSAGRILRDLRATRP